MHSGPVAMDADNFANTFLTFITFITSITYSSSHLHMPNQMLIDPMIRVVHELFL